MRRFIPIIAITLFAFLSAIPLFTNQTTCSDDGFFHIAKAVTLEQMIRDGQPFGRWSPEMAHGFGYPYFNYYAPLPSYILIAIHSLGFIYPVALHIFFALCIWIAGLATYFFVRDWMNDAAGVAASVVYMTAPYLAFDILFRSALAESFALVFPPLILFFAHRSLSNFQLPTSNFHFWDLGFALSIAALLYTHNITALITLPLIVGYVVLHTLINRNPRALIFNSLIIILGLSLAARFWLPALTERNLVQSDKLLVPPIFTYYTNYLSLNELLAPPSFIDPLIINPSPAKALGLVTALLALIGFAAVISNQWSVISKQKSPISNLQSPTLGIWGLGFGIFFFIYSSLTLSFTQPLWDSVPLMPFIQFPWRLLGIASLCAAILSGAVVYWLPQRAWLLSGVVITVAALGNLSWWYPRYCSPFKEVTLANTIQYEFDTFTLGTSAKGEFLPNTVKNFPQDDS
ncbi:MAG: 6-pyruvoyl-tetrahydropterin synthase-related protein, partial [Chloroflexota bacterium]